jgi:hypothetical protein
MRTSFVLELHGEWSEFAEECIGLNAIVTFKATAVCWPLAYLLG